MESVFDALHEVARAEGFGDVFLGAGIEADEPGEFAFPRGEQDDGNGGGGGQMVEEFADGEAVHFGQHEVEDDEVGKRGTGLIEGFAAIGGGDDIVAFRPQVEADQFDNVGFIIHDQNLLSHPIWLARGAAKPQRREGYGSVTICGKGSQTADFLTLVAPFPWKFGILAYETVKRENHLLYSTVAGLVAG